MHNFYVKKFKVSEPALKHVTPMPSKNTKVGTGITQVFTPGVRPN